MKPKSSGPDLLILGLDGVPFSMLRDLAARGIMPHMQPLLAQGQARSISSSIPEVSSTAWTSFMTGTNPGVHGIFGFFDPAGETYALRFPNAASIRVPTLWHRLSRAGKRCLVLNMPQTYPAFPVNGVLVSGFVAPDLNRAVSPESLLPDLRALDYRVDVNAWLAREDQDQFVHDLFQVLETRTKTLRMLWERDSWDVIAAVFTGTDRLQHYLWHAVQDPAHPRHRQTLEFYTAVDRAIGECLDRIRDDTFVMIVSDHGFTGVAREVNLNAWFREQGILKISAGAKPSLENMDASSTAFALDPGRIYLNRADRFTRGWISPGIEYAQQRQEMKTRLESELRIRDASGNRLNPVEAVLLSEEVYAGPLAARAPDLIVQGAAGIDFKGSLAISEVARNDVLTGMHTREDAALVVLDPRGNQSIDAVTSLEDIAPLLLRAAGIDAPDG